MRTSALLLLSSGVFVLPCSLPAQTLPACDAARVIYSDPPKDVEEKIQISRPGATSVSVPLGTKVRSTQGTRWLIDAEPDYIKDGPWTSTLYIGESGSTQASLIVSVRDHDNTFHADWINEDLLFIQVWWGRFASSDLILDVAHGHLVYDRLAHYGQIGEPCS